MKKKTEKKKEEKVLLHTEFNEAKKSLLFIGTEAEGPYKGTLTLFVGEPDTSFPSILRVLALNRDIKQVYFGANNNRGISVENSRNVQDLLDSGYLVTIEITDMGQLEFITVSTQLLLHVVLAVPINRIGPDAVKFYTNDVVEWFDLRRVQSIQTSLTDPLYSKDTSV